MDQSTPHPPIVHCLLELGQIHVGSFYDTVQLSHPLLSPSPLAFTLSQHQSLFQGCYSDVFELQLPETPASTVGGEGLWELQSKTPE